MADNETIAKKLSLPVEMVERLRDGDVEGVKAELLERSNSVCEYPWWATKKRILF